MLGESTTKLVFFFKKTSGNELIESFLDLTLPFQIGRLVTFFTAKGNQTPANLFDQFVEAQSSFDRDRANSFPPYRRYLDISLLLGFFIARLSA